MVDSEARELICTKIKSATEQEQGFVVTPVLCPDADWGGGGVC